MQATSFQHSILQWFDQHGRKDLPWQKNKNYYRVWVSEIMLQQTQVSTVIPYFEKWMKRFPTIESLAAADSDEVMRYWSGLGYYARARNLHKAAKVVVEDYNAVFPTSHEEIQKLPGVGRSTGAAILALTDNQALAILDGNVKRVLSRFEAVEGWPGNPKVEAELWEVAERLMPEKRAADYTQAMMDLGATLCTRTKPNCLLCPVQEHCKARLSGNPEQYPHRKPKTEYPTKSACFLILCHDNSVLLEKRPSHGIWGGLWTLLSFESIAALTHWLTENGINDKQEILPQCEHKFTHYRLLFTPIVVELSSYLAHLPNNWQWHSIGKLDTLGLPAPVRALLNQLYSFSL